jgi:hypothetical protein
MALPTLPLKVNLNLLPADEDKDTPNAAEPRHLDLWPRNAVVRKQFLASVGASFLLERRLRHYRLSPFNRFNVASKL